MARVHLEKLGHNFEIQLSKDSLQAIKSEDNLSLVMRLYSWNKTKKFTNWAELVEIG